METERNPEGLRDYPMFLNPWRTGERSSYNVVAARRFLAIYLIWRVASYPWPDLADWPTVVYDERFASILPDALLPARAYLLPIAVVVIALLVAVVATQYWRYAALLAGTGLILLGAFHHSIDNQGKRWMVPALFLFIFALFPPRPEDSSPPGPASNPLCWTLLALATTYWLVVWHRLVGGHIPAWVQGDNLLRTIRWEALRNLGIPETFAEPVLHAVPLLATLAAAGAVVTEVSLLVFVLLRRSISIPAIALIGMHLGILVSMHLFFVESIALMLIFLNWEGLRARLATVPLPRFTGGRSRPATGHGEP